MKTKSDVNLNAKVTPQVMALIDLLVEQHNKGKDYITRRQVLVAGIMILAELVPDNYNIKNAALEVYNSERKKQLLNTYLPENE